MSNFSLQPTNNQLNFNSNIASTANASMFMPSVSMDRRRTNHQQGTVMMTTQNGEPFLKDWEVTVTGYSNKDVAGLAEYNSVKELIDRNGGRIHTNLLLTTTHVIGRKGSTEKCVAAWEHNKKLLLAEKNSNRRKNVANSYKEILVVIPEYVPAYLNHRFEVEELRLLAKKKKQEEDLINNGNDSKNHEDEPEAKNPQQLQQDESYNENDKNNNLPSLLRRDEEDKEEDDEDEKIQSNTNSIPELNIEPYLVKPLTGFTISYTGYPEHVRAELEARIQFLGGEVSRAMTGDIDYLLVPSGVEIPVDLGGICSQQQNHNNNNNNVSVAAVANQLNMEKLRLADASKIDIVYCEYFLSVLAEKKQTIQQVAKLAKVKRGKLMSMSQSLHATTQKILGGTSSIHNNNINSTGLTLSTIAGGNGMNNSFSSTTNPFLSILNLSQQPQITSNGNNQNLQTDSAPCSQPQGNNNNNHISSGSLPSSRRASVSPFVSSQQVSPTNNNNNTFPFPPPPPFTISPQLLSEFATFTQDAIVCALFTTDDQLRNLTWLMNTLAIPVVTIPSAHKVNETVFLLGTELDPVYHDTVKKYFERQFNISDFIRSSFCLHLWLNSVAELMMNFSTVSNQIDELERNRQLGEEEEQKIQEKLRAIEENDDTSVKDDDESSSNNNNSEEFLRSLRSNLQIIQEFLQQLQQQRNECLAIREKIETQVSAIFSRDPLQPAKSLDNHPILFPNHTMSYLGWVEHENERHGNNNSMLYSSQQQQQSYRRNSYYSQLNFKDGNDDDDVDNHNSEGIHLPSQHFDVSKMVSRILAKSQFSQKNNNNNNNNNASENGAEQQKQTSASNNIISKNSTIQVSRNPATKTMFSHLFFVIDGAMTEECLRLTKHAVHLGGGKYSISGNSINNNNSNEQSNNSTHTNTANTYFVISHSCQRLWGEPSLKENERRQKGYSQDVTLDWLLHCLSFGKFVDPKLCFAFNTPVNKIQLHHLPTPGTASNHASMKRGNMIKNFSQARGAMNNNNSSDQNNSATENSNSNTAYIASCYVSEPRKYFKKQIQHVGVVAFVPQCGEFAQMVDVFSNVITLLGGNSIKLTDPTFSYNNGILPTEAAQKLTHIIFPKGNWLDLKSAISSSRLNSPLIQSQETNNNNNNNNDNNNGSRIRQRTVSILGDDHQNEHDKKNNNNNNHNTKLTSSSNEKEIVQYNIEWLASAISCLPSDHTKKMVPQQTSASTGNQSQSHHRHNHHHQNNQQKLNPNLLYVVSSEWLDVSARAGYFVDETQFLVEAKLTSSSSSFIAVNTASGIATNKAKNNNNNNLSMTQLVNNTQNMTSSQVAEKLEKSGILVNSGNTQNEFLTQQQPSEVNKKSKSITNNFIVIIPQDKNINHASNNNSNSTHHGHHTLSNENSNSISNNNDINTKSNVMFLPSQLSEPSVPESFEMSRFMVAIEAEHSQQQQQQQQVHEQQHHHQNLFLMIDESQRLNPDGAASLLPPLIELEHEQERSRVSDNTSHANNIRSSFFDEVEEDICEELPSRIDQSIIVESESQKNCSFTREEDLLHVFQHEENRRPEHEENESNAAPNEDIPPSVALAEQTSHQEQEEHFDAPAIVESQSQRANDERDDDHVVAEMIFEEKNNFEDDHGNSGSDKNVNNCQNENDAKHDPPRNSSTNASGRPSAALIVNRYSTTSLFAKSARNSTRPSFHPPFQHNGNNNTQHQNAFVNLEDSGNDKNGNEDSALLLLPRNSFFSRETWNIFGDGAHLVSGKKVQLLLSASEEQEVLRHQDDDGNTNEYMSNQQHLRKVEFMETTDLDLAHIVVHSRISQTGIILASIAARKWICTTELIQNILAAHHFTSRNNNYKNNNNNNSSDPFISRGIICLPKFEWTSKIIEDNYQQAVIAVKNSKISNNKQELDKEIQLLKKASQLQKNVVESAIYWRKTLSDFTNESNLITNSSSAGDSSSSSQSPFAHIKAMFWLTPKKDKMVETQEREEVLSRIIESGGGQVTKFDLPLTVATDVANFLRFRGSEVGICHLFVSDEVLNDPYVNQMESLATLCGALNKNGGQSIPSNNSHNNNNNNHHSSSVVNTTRSRSPPPPQRRRIEVFSESYLSKVLLRKALPVPMYLYVSTIQQN